MSASDLEYKKWVSDKYNGLVDIWARNDLWHTRMREDILQAVAREGRRHGGTIGTVIDIGSGGLVHDVNCVNYVQLDLAYRKLIGKKNGICADAHKLPFLDRTADQIICVGSVLNYCSLIEVVNELARIANAGARLILHAELSNSLGLLLTPHFRADATFVTTIYQGEERLWLYSQRNIRKTLQNAGFLIVEERYFHIISALAQRIIGNHNRAARFAKLDRLLGKISVFGSIADNAIFICERTT